MTSQCREVMANCDFVLADARYVEMFLCKATPAQIEALVWRKDPDGVHAAEWFAPFFNNGYVRSKVGVKCSFSDAFWYAYDWLSQALPEDFSTFDLPAIDEMSADLERMKFAFGKCRVKKVSYLLAVYRGEQRAPRTADNSGAIRGWEVGSCGAVPRGGRQ